MDNYLNHRWPKGPGTQPPPMPGYTAPRPPVQRRRRSPRRWLVSAVCVVLCLALLAGTGIWAINGLANLATGGNPPGSSEPPSPRHTRNVPNASEWSLDDLPWGDPDPSVQLSLTEPDGTILSGRDIHEKVTPSLVYVEAQEKGGYRSSVFSGTGIIVTASGYVLTNFHIVEDTEHVQVTLLSDPAAYYDAKVIGVDEKFDVAVLKFDGEGLDLTPAQLGDSDTLAVGDRVYAVGNPMGYLLGSMTEGIVSALNRESEVDSSGLGLIQTSAALNPGNSGGALVNESGQVVGITSAKITGLVREEGDSLEDAAVIENIGLAVPTTDILPFVNRMIATGKSWRPSIGITCTETKVDGRRGIQVITVDEGTPAEKAGLRTGDLIVSANGAAVADLASLRRVIYHAGVGGQLRCVVVRDGREVPVTFTLIDKIDA